MFKNKLNEEGELFKHKDRLVAQKYNPHERIPYEETFELVARVKAIRILLAYKVHRY